MNSRFSLRRDFFKAKNQTKNPLKAPVFSMVPFSFMLSSGTKNKQALIKTRRTLSKLAGRRRSTYEQTLEGSSYLHNKTSTLCRQAASSGL